MGKAIEFFIIGWMFGIVTTGIVVAWRDPPGTWEGYSQIGSIDR